MTKELEKYYKLVKLRPKLFKEIDAYPIILDEEKIAAFEKESGRSIGVVYESAYNYMIVDLIQGPNACFAYERLVPVNTGGIAVLPIYNHSSIVLLDQWRHATRKKSLQLPRGFGNPNVPAKENVTKELCEELHIFPNDIHNIRHLGVIEPDSGITSNQVHVFVCDITKYALSRGYEGIYDVRLIPLSNILDAVTDNLITDAMTLSALMMYKAS